MGLYLLGLNDIVLTDISPVMPTFKRNLKRDKPVLSKNLKHCVLYWKNQDQVQALNPTFDVVIATDIVYIEESVDPLISSMDAPLAENGVVLLRHQLRSPEAHKLFWEMSERIFEIQEVPHEDLQSEYAYDETYVYIFRKKKNKEEEDQEANP